MSDGIEQASSCDLVDIEQEQSSGLRRRWPEALKRQIVAETHVPGASVSVVARRHGVHANQVFTWRRRYAVRPSAGLPALVPVRLEPGHAGKAREPAQGGTIELELSDGSRVRIVGAVDGAALRQVLEHLR